MEMLVALVLADAALALVCIVHFVNLRFSSGAVGVRQGGLRLGGK